MLNNLIFYLKNWSNYLKKYFPSFKVHTGCYYIRRLKSGNWFEAEHECGKENGHLWSINSHSELIHVRRSLGSFIWNDHDRITGFSSVYIINSYVSFIGLTKEHKQVSIHLKHSAYPDLQ